MKKILFISLLVLCFVKTGEFCGEYFKHLPEKTRNLPETFKVTATMYYAVPGQCDESPLITACGYKINPKKATEHKWIAVSRDLLKKFKYGDKVKISNAGDKDGIYTIADTMNKRFKNKIDFLETKGTSLYKLNDVVLTKVTEV
jgi:3D (Asp-Asp-Asp) domain-containing protein